MEYTRNRYIKLLDDILYIIICIYSCRSDIHSFPLLLVFFWSNLQFNIPDSSKSLSFFRLRKTSNQRWPRWSNIPTKHTSHVPFGVVQHHAVTRRPQNLKIWCVLFLNVTNQRDMDFLTWKLHGLFQSQKPTGWEIVGASDKWWNFKIFILTTTPVQQNIATLQWKKCHCLKVSR